MERLDKTATTYLCERPQKQTQRKKETVKLKPFCQLIEAKKKERSPSEFCALRYASSKSGNENHSSQVSRK